MESAASEVNGQRKWRDMWKRNSVLGKVGKHQSLWRSLFMVMLVGLGAGRAAAVVPWVATDFSAGLPASATLYGNAALSNGALVLTPPQIGTLGAILFSNLNGGEALEQFRAEMDVAFFRPDGGTPGDGLSFNFASDLTYPPSNTAEFGVGSGLSVCIQIYPADPPAVTVLWHGATLASFATQLAVLNSPTPPAYRHLVMTLCKSGLFNLTIDGSALFTDLPIPWAPTTGRFGIYARTGGVWANQWIRSLSLGPATGTPFQFTPPSDVTVWEGQSATFTAQLTGAGCSGFFQWSKNGVAIPGANASSYTLASALASDNGATFSILVTNEVCSNAATALLTVRHDSEPPLS